MCLASKHIFPSLLNIYVYAHKLLFFPPAEQRSTLCKGCWLMRRFRLGKVLRTRDCECLALVWMPISPSSRLSEHRGKAGGKNVPARHQGWNHKTQPRARAVVAALTNSESCGCCRRQTRDRTTKCLITDGEGAPRAQTHSRELMTVRGCCWRTGSGVATGDSLMLRWISPHRAPVSNYH